MVLGAYSSRPTGSFRQRPKTYKARKVGISDASRQRTQTKLLTDVDHYLTLREPCVASLRSDRHEIGMTDRHHRNAHSAFARAFMTATSETSKPVTFQPRPARKIELRPSPMQTSKATPGVRSFTTSTTNGVGQSGPTAPSGPYMLLNQRRIASGRLNARSEIILIRRSTSAFGSPCSINAFR